MQSGHDKPDSYIPSWDGSSRTWRRYCIEVSWFVSGTKADQRQYAAAKSITRLSGPARLLSMSWRQCERGVAKMLQCFAASPLLRRSRPNAASTMSEYFSFRRKVNEPIAQFLVREALGFEEFQEALLQLKEEREGRDPSQRAFDLPEITGLTSDSYDGQRPQSWWQDRCGAWRGVGSADNNEDDDVPQDGGEADQTSPRPDGYTEIPQQSDPGSPAVSPSEVVNKVLLLAALSVLTALTGNPRI